jgi:hypothetical protein
VSVDVGSGVPVGKGWVVAQAMEIEMSTKMKSHMGFILFNCTLPPGIGLDNTLYELKTQYRTP